MKELMLIATVIGNLTVTSYRALRSQTDDTPFYTSINERVRGGGCAVSRDLLCPACLKRHRRCTELGSKHLHYGDWIYIDGYGFRQVNDVMGAYTTERANGRKIRTPLVRHVDLFVDTWREERAIGTRQMAVYRVDVNSANPALFEVHATGTIKGGGHGTN